MRTIIINTLGSELRRNPLFYLPFDENRFHWIEKDLNDLSDCSEEIAVHNENQDKNRDYNLVVLVSLGGFAIAKHEAVRNCYTRLLKAYINHSLLNRMVDSKVKLPEGVSIVFVMPDPDDGTGGVTDGKEYDAIFNFPENKDELDQLIISSDDGSVRFDLTDMYADQISDFKSSYENEKKVSVSEKPSKTLDDFRKDLIERTAGLQDCKYFMPGRKTAVVLPVEVLEYMPRTDNWSLLSADIQMNLSNHIAKQTERSEWKLELVPHDEDEMQQRISRAKARVSLLLDNPAVKYCPLEISKEEVLGSDITNDIWASLIGDGSLPWLKEAQDYASQAAVGEVQDTPAKKIRHAWLLINREKKRFERQYEQLSQQYDGEEAKKQEQEILGTCAKAFGRWRKKRLTIDPPAPGAATLAEMPLFDDTAAKEALKQAQQDYGKTSAECLENYEDLRAEAEVLKAKVNKAFRLWPGDGYGATKRFCIYSIILAVLFVLQMILPYVGITMAERAEFSRYVHFLASLALFAGLYFVGVLFWMRALCKELAGYTAEMASLINKSNKRRRDSVINAVQLYGKILPNCTVKYEELEELHRINCANLQRKEHFNAHILLLEKADEILREMFTLLRLPDSTAKAQAPRKGSINFELAPSHPENVPFYVLFSEDWGC